MPRVVEYRKEADVKRQVKKYLDFIGAWYYMPVPTGLGVAGIPDFLCCYKGVFFAIETKYGYNKPTPLQERQLQKIRDAGAMAIVINETNIDKLPEMVMNHVALVK